MKYLKTKQEVTEGLEIADDIKQALDRPLCYMFNDDFTEYDLAFNSYIRYNSIRSSFWETDIESLNDYSVMINVHDDGPNGTFIIHKDFVDLFYNTDDYNISFTG